MADITGNGKADYLFIEKDGRTSGYIHRNDDSLDHKDQMKFADDRDRFTGDGTVWYNRGEEDIGGSNFHWDRVGKAYTGSVAGSCIYFTDLNGDGTADMHSITDSLKGRATTYYNGCEDSVERR
ncbi:hypothetical protein BDW66DRAFT_151802 [Aspergillus desertorum]